MIRKYYLAHKAFFLYFFISAFVTLLDMGTSRLCESFLPVLIANSLGIIVGFIVQYILTSRHVYNNKNSTTFLKFLLTFFIGFLLANGIVYLCREWLFSGAEGFSAFIISKGLSIAIPFFVVYFIRKKWIGER